MVVPLSRRISARDLFEEPFRLFFPAAVLVGFLGVMLWPMYFAGLYPNYPGISHARLMAHGFFGGFILGFLGTALPRMLSVPHFSRHEIGVFLGLYAVMVTAHLAGRNVLGDGFLLCLLIAFTWRAGIRFARRNDLPPPGFVLLPLAFGCAAAGAILSLVGIDPEASAPWMTLQRLLLYQGFVLLPILGVGAFILPRFFGAASRHEFPESTSPPPGWFSTWA